METLQSIALGAIGGIIVVIVEKVLEKRVKSQWALWGLTLLISCAIVAISCLLYLLLR